MRIGFALLGGLLMVGGFAARIVASRHVPGFAPGTYILPAQPPRTGWPTATYDLVRIGGWALLIFGAVIIALALVREFRAAR